MRRIQQASTPTLLGLVAAAPAPGGGPALRATGAGETLERAGAATPARRPWTVRR